MRGRWRGGKRRGDGEGEKEKRNSSRKGIKDRSEEMGREKCASGALSCTVLREGWRESTGE